MGAGAATYERVTRGLLALQTLMLRRLFHAPPLYCLTTERAAVVPRRPPSVYSAPPAGVAELADALRSGRSGSIPVRVRVPASAPLAPQEPPKPAILIIESRVFRLIPVRFVLPVLT